MKKKKVISVIVLFSLALSSCKGCPSPPERTYPDLVKLDELIEKLPYGSGRELFKTASKALKLATDVLDDPAHAKRDAYRVAKGFSSSAGNALGVVIDRRYDLTSNAREAARHSVFYSEYVVGKVTHHIPLLEFSSIGVNAFDAVKVRDFARDHAGHDTVNVVNELAKKVEELERSFEDWQSRQLGH